MNNVRRLIGVALVCAAVGLSGCIDSTDDIADPNIQLQADVKAIDDYLAANFIGAQKDPSGIRMEITKLGTGLPARSINSTVDVDYVGKFFPDGAGFDQGNIKGTLKSYITGWQIAFTKLPVGTQARLYIPSGWAYGTTGQNGIPANSILQFDVDFNEAVITSTEKTQFTTDTTAINKYFETNSSAGVIKDTTGIRYVITQQGSGASISWFTKVNFKITYRLLSNPTSVVATVTQTPSDTFYSRPVDFIQGIMIGLQKLTVGDKATIYVPSGLGFGTNGATDSNGSQVIGSNANLIVDLEVLGVQ
ncbi:FKBP-type peptidyl-prolyl cis-trans isomerase [Ohtaekwangia koreensis]|uniref:Peptidyl-prolyl cis-trans isomerase n=1 Tax=Ohtaekwangia koreensis TaxID=688867 RepID=A0A1T5LEH1_9BACT|nr:FKBP-type peptidyl-prolyl cis-trans isomerase [Ohtaekwangia koreensis]SKC74039.1 FKBP-type peptidyl-prolyl cis-trans isomerase [Ohtaekwangia koreensis]